MSQQETDWIEWGGGDCPVPDHALVHVRTLRKEYVEDMRAGAITKDRWSWGESIPVGGHIIAYRVVPA